MAGEAVSFPYAGKLAEPVFTFGGEASQNGENVTIPPVSAGIYKID